MATTPTPITSTGESSSGFMSSLTDRISSALSAEPGTPSTPSTPAPETPSTSSSPAPAQAQPVPVAPAQVPAEPEEFKFSDEVEEKPEDKQAKPVETQPAQESKPDDQAKPAGQEDTKSGLPKDAVDQLMKSERGRRMYAAFGVMQELEKSPEEGGLGFVPTTDQIIEAFDNHSDYQVMQAEFDSNDPAKQMNWVKHWFSPGEGGKLSQAQINAAQYMAAGLAQSGPEAYVAAAKPFIYNFYRDTIEEMKKLPDKDDRIFVGNAAKYLWYRLTGQDLQIPADLIEKGSSPQDPLAGREAELRRREQALSQSTQQRQQESRQAFEAKFDSARTGVLRKFADEALSAAKSGLPAKYYDSILSSFISDVEKGIKSNLYMLRPYNQAKERALTTQSDDDMQSALSSYTQLAKTIIRRLRGQYLSEASAQISQESTARHSTATSAEGRNLSTSGAAPVAQSLVPGKPERAPGETYEEYLQRMVGGVISQ